MRTLPTTEVVPNQRRTTGGMVYILALGVVGAGIAAATWAWSLGFCGYGVAGFFVFMFGLGFVRTMAYGGAWKADCPGCGATLTSDEHPFPLKSHKVVHCGRCDGWWGGTELLQPLDADHVHGDPIFEALVHPPLAWPEGCARCGDAATSTVTLTAVSDAANLASAAGVVSLGGEGVVVPVCGKHRQTPVSVRTTGGRLGVEFRSYRIFRAFRALNAEVDLEEFVEVVDPLDEHLAVYKAPFRCPVHDRPLRVRRGWRSRMDVSPAGSFMDDAADHPCCVGPGEGLGRAPERADVAHVAFCPDCVVGMESRGWTQ